MGGSNSVFKAEAQHCQGFQRRGSSGAAARPSSESLHLHHAQSLIFVVQAELLAHYYPKLVEIHNYSAANSFSQKMYADTIPL